MDSAPSRKEKRELTREAFDLLLARLDPDRNTAGEKYEAVRRKLLKFLGWWGSDFPEDHADETINRVTRKLLAGEEIRRHQQVFCRCGTAGLCWNTSKSASGIAKHSPGWRDVQLLTSIQGIREARFECYERCLQTLPDANRDLVIKYYQASGGNKAALQDRSWPSEWEFNSTC